MSRFATVNLLDVEDSMGDRAPGVEVRFGRKHLDSRDLGVTHVRYAPEPARPEGAQPPRAGRGLCRRRRLRSRAAR